MTPHLDASRIAEYLARTLPAADVMDLHSHLETCPECRTALEEAALEHFDSVNLPLLMEEPDPSLIHLTEEEMTDFVARRMPESARVDAARHIAACELCLDSVEAMESVRVHPPAIPIRPRRVRWFAIAGALAAAALILIVLGRDRFMHPAAPPAAVSVASLLDAGHPIELDANGQLSGLTGASPEERNLVRSALTRRTLPVRPGIANETPGVLLTPGVPATQAFTLLSPVNDRVVSDRPVLSWNAYPGAIAYQVLITNESLDPLTRSERITATEWQPAVPLPRSTPLLWQVRAWRGNEMVSSPAPPAPPARFEVAEADVAARLEQLRAAPHSSHLLIAVLCARDGLRGEAINEIGMLAKENPGSPLIANFLASLSPR